MKSFQVKVEGELLDYRVGKTLNLKEVTGFFQKKYTVRRIWSGGRHVLGIIERNGRELFLKLATTEGIGAVTQIEYNWNEQFNTLIPPSSSCFWVPQNFDSGFYNNLFYLVTERIDGKLLAEKPEKTPTSQRFLDLIPQVIEFSELIQTLSLKSLSSEGSNLREDFYDKACSWYADIPEPIKEKYRVGKLLDIVTTDKSILAIRSRHGDFTPWHIMTQKNNLILLDGEHARGNGVEYYDIGYFIQRVYSVLENPELAKKIFSLLQERNYNAEKLKIIFAGRAIGGFLDESLKEIPNYSLAHDFQKWVMSL